MIKSLLKQKMRKTYKFSHSVCQGGYLYAHKTAKQESIKNKEGLKNCLQAIAKRFELIDVTIKVYDSIFFFFFMTKPLVKPIELIKSIQNNTSCFCLWDPNYLYTGVYDLQEQYVRKDLKKLDFDYDKG